MDYMINHKHVKSILNSKSITHEIFISLNNEEGWFLLLRSLGLCILLMMILEYQRIVLVWCEEDFDEGGNMCVMIQPRNVPPPSIKQLKSISQSSPNFYLLGSVRSI